MAGHELLERVGNVPEGAYLLPIQVRSYEVLRNGTISPATLLRYLEYIATEASAYLGFDHRWYETHGSAWVVREMNVEFGHLPGIDADLILATWLSSYKRVQADREYAVWDRQSGKRVARARARWAYIDRYRGVPMRIHDELLVRFPLLGHSMRPLATRYRDAVQKAGTRRYNELTAREYEADTQQHVNNCAYVDWLYEALHAAAPAALDLSANQAMLPRRYQIEYARPTMPGDAVRIETDLARIGSRMVAVAQEIDSLTTSATSVRAYSEHLIVTSREG